MCRLLCRLAFASRNGGRERRLQICAKSPGFKVGFGRRTPRPKKPRPMFQPAWRWGSAATLSWPGPMWTPGPGRKSARKRPHHQGRRFERCGFLSIIFLFTGLFFLSCSSRDSHDTRSRMTKRGTPPIWRKLGGGRKCCHLRIEIVPAKPIDGRRYLARTLLSSAFGDTQSTLFSYGSLHRRENHFYILTPPPLR